ncbi:IS3 family transposase [Lysinibacillus fusiformis]|uniref:IS3 family transposase n=1 Tax=Lysinibacillus fusiformis TaxID=28031 RepID=UPI003D037615
MTIRISRKGTPANNSPIETFHSSLKSKRSTSTEYIEHLICLIRIFEEYIHYYNNIRVQTKLNNHSPEKYRQLAV